MAMGKLIANKKETKKRGNPAWEKGGASPNPAGRPKDGESWSAIIKEVGNMYPDDLLGFIGRGNDLGRDILKYPKNVQMKYLVVARVYAALMFDPNNSMFKELMDRSEGKVPEKVQHEGTLNVKNLEAIIEKVYGSDDRAG